MLFRSAILDVHILTLLLFAIKDWVLVQSSISDQTCEKSTCPDIPDDSVTRMECSDGFMVGSTCRFSCPPYRGRVGESSVHCQLHPEARGIAEWSSRIPYCRALFCPELPHVNGARIDCTRKRKLGSICKYKCVGTYGLVPLGHTGFMCYKNATWIGDPLPCCRRNSDFVVILDSSSSVGPDNWKILKEFTRSFLEDSLQQSVRVGVFRYNERVDTASQILLNNYVDDFEGLLQAVDTIPYDGRGTRIGRALRYAQRVVLTPQNGMRPNALHTILLLTNRVSQDDVELVSQQLREQFVEVYVIGIFSRRGRIDVNDLVTIAGSVNNVYVLDGFESLTKLRSSHFERFTANLTADDCSKEELQ